MDYDVNLLHTSRQNPLLVRTLNKLMSFEALKDFRLVGGTNLALVYDHRYSVDIDLFTDKEYGTVDFQKIEETMKAFFPSCITPSKGPSAFGKTYFVGNSVEDSVKVDIMYTDSFLDPADNYGPLRLATRNDITAMKMEAIATGPRKKDFWDIHFLLGYYTLEHMIAIHQCRHPYTHNSSELLEKMLTFEEVETEPAPICYLGKEWADIKLDIITEVERVKECQ